MQSQRTERSAPAQGDLIVMTPIVQGKFENVIRVQRYQCDEKVDGPIRHVGDGPHVGIIVRHFSPEHEATEPSVNPHLHLDFAVFLKEASTGKTNQERRVLRFWFYDEVPTEARHQLAQAFFRDIIKGGFPKNYILFIRAVLKAMQASYHEIRRLDVDMLLEKEHIEHAPTSVEHEHQQQIVTVTSAHVQEILEHAFPNGLSAEYIAQSLQCSVELVIELLEELRVKGVLSRRADSGEWVRVDVAAQHQHDAQQQQSSSPDASGAASPCASPVGGMAIPGMTSSMRSSTLGGQGQRPTVAIISALFVEKMAVDAMIDNKVVLHRYKSDGESNVYTLGEIGGHKVVATKLSAIGNTRQAMTAAGSITTRLLGNFQHVEHVFVVGCAGGVENFTDGERHIRRGDVVVSSGKNSYVFCERLELDRHTERVKGFSSRNWSPVDNVVHRITHDLQQSHTAAADKSGESPWAECVDAELVATLNRQLASADYSFDRPARDADAIHVPDGSGNFVMMPHPPRANEGVPRLHTGTIAGASAVGDNAELRDKYAGVYGARAFTADFDAVVDSIHGNRIDSWALVRGISDYADGTRNRLWQAYAALQAAAMTKMLITRLPVPE